MSKPKSYLLQFWRENKNRLPELLDWSSDQWFSFVDEDRLDNARDGHLHLKFLCDNNPDACIVALFQICLLGEYIQYQPKAEPSRDRLNKKLNQNIKRSIQSWARKGSPEEEILDRLTKKYIKAEAEQKDRTYTKHIKLLYELFRRANQTTKPNKILATMAALLNSLGLTNQHQKRFTRQNLFKIINRSLLL